MSNQKIETVHYDGSYCPVCLSENVEIKDSSHDFGWSELEVTGKDCNTKYSSMIDVSKHLNYNSVVEIIEKGVKK